MFRQDNLKRFTFAKYNYPNSPYDGHHGKNDKKYSSLAPLKIKRKLISVKRASPKLVDTYPVKKPGSFVWLVFRRIPKKNLL